MSDFDKEAEREKLREQLEREQADREATQRMSELLLGGATMTGRHCERCSSPIFRQNGQEFCPNCNQAVGETPQKQADQEQASQEQVAEAEGSRPETDDGDERAIDAAGTSQPQVEPVESTSRPAAGRESSPTPGGGEVAVADGDLAEARDALARKLTRLASQAEATEDVGRARELLAATREAAEALAALEAVGN